MLMVSFKPHIIFIFVDKVLDSREQSLVMEFAPQDNLWEQTLLTAEDLNTIVLHISKALNHFSRCPIIAKLGDFGFASNDVMKSLYGTEVFTAPEILRLNISRRGRKGRKSDEYFASADIWSLGITILTYSLYIGFPPFAQNAPLSQQYEWTKCMPLKSYKSRPGWENVSAVSPWIW